MNISKDEHIVLVLDIGTTGAKAIIFDSFGNIRALSYREYKSIYVAAKVIDHDPETWISAIQSSVKELKSMDPQLFAKVTAVSVTTQRATLLPVDENGTPLDNAILWQDKRTRGECKEIERFIDGKTIYKKTGLKIDPYFSLPKLLWFRNNKPEIYNQASYFLTTHDYIIHVLTSEFKTDWTQASRTMMFNINDFEWDRDIIKSLEVDVDKLPEACPTGTIAGHTNLSCRKKLGIPEGIPVVMAGGDQQAAAIGMGAIEQGSVKVTLGTGAFVVAPIERKSNSDKQKVLVSASAVLGSWVIEAGIFTAGATYRWLRDELLASDVKNRDKPPYEILNDMVEQSQPGAGGVLHLPHYSGSAAPYWNPNAVGLLFNLTLGTKKSNVVRSYLEGISFEINKNLQIVNELLKVENGQGLSSVHVSGGLVNSDFFNQVQSDVYGLPVIPDQTEQASALGAAMIAFVATRTYSNLNEACQAMVQLDEHRTKHPNAELAELYQQLSHLHDSLYHALNEADIYNKSSEVLKNLKINNLTITN